MGNPEKHDQKNDEKIQQLSSELASAKQEIETLRTRLDDANRALRDTTDENEDLRKKLEKQARQMNRPPQSADAPTARIVAGVDPRMLAVWDELDAVDRSFLEQPTEDGAFPLRQRMHGLGLVDLKTATRTQLGDAVLAAGKAA